MSSTVVADDVQHAAGLEARRSFVIDEMHGHVDRQGRVLAETQEVDVDDEVANDFALHVARNDAFDLAVDVDVQQMAGEGARLVEGVHGLVVDGDKFRGLLVAVNHGGDAACETKRTNSPLAALRACLGLERQCLGHSVDSPTKIAPVAGCLRRLTAFPPGVWTPIWAVYSAGKGKTQAGGGG